MWSKSSTKPSLETYMGPRRLLKVTACSTEDAGGGESSSEDGLHQQLSLRLVEVDVDMLDSPYITLSHCWGSSEPGRHPSGLTLRTETLDEFSHRGISNAALDHPHARTFKDAARVVLDLGFTYLWIDALCIIQNDPLDRKREVAKMDTIYRRGLFNIAATGGFDGRDGLFLDDNSAFMYQPAEFPRRSLGGRDRFGISGPEEHFVAFLDRELKGVGIQDPLNSRGWVLQECLLSARVLSFCKADVYWYCNTQKTSTTSSDDFFKEVRCYDAHCVRMPRLPQNWVRLEANLSNQTQARGWQTSIGEQISAWQEVLRLYGPTRVSYNGDRLVALSALARNFYRVTNNPTISYVAGLWSCWRNRCRQLTWRSDVNVDSDVRRHQVFPELPSWSPLRHRGKFAFDDDASDEDPTWRIEVVAIETDWQGVGGGIFGAIKGGKLTLQGALLGRVSGEPPVDVLWTKDGHRTEAYRYSEHDSRYVMIFRGPTSLQAPQGWPMRGLILEKTHQRPGQYVRVGHVSVDEGELLQAKYWYGGSGGISKPVEDDYLQFAYGTYIIELV
ncbi:uncharacterized protein HMPREF1541_06131 [Cyphellophora europaea CBS 101466]|uniref:Heterokaryon incompatibility domain-containing protein n=1 Tax=Cyphellophora europaea (strain CBS 101466) TaxID=1220924 RepID=W2RUD5_CYPE1|nr:uncharacterized protein HMPREF1541_06131 [Cyphellophora europaea CBS 101466]ETN39905.1 hypothetical protein HMPREF1541_06131 [Cyphellophora europaea CBS 101466]